MNVPTVLVVFGTTGDLMARKIVPSLAYLSVKGRLPDRFRVLGWGRRGWDDGQLRAYVGSVLDAYDGLKPDGAERAAFLELFSSHNGDFGDDAAYEALSGRLAQGDDAWGQCSNKLFYLAVPPQYYLLILQQLANSGLTQPCSEETGYTRVLVEKPFGKDAASAQDLDELLGSLFREEQIYRIDHYLAKDMLQGIVLFRFSNAIFEPSWSAEFVERIDIVLHEAIGVESRGAFYDGVGALRDVGQNHLLQMLALVTMDSPGDLDSDSIRSGRLAMLHQLRPLVADEVALRTFRAQYDGYSSIDGVDPASDTETFFRIETMLTGQRWGGVPVMMESGKRMGPALKRIEVTFKPGAGCTCHSEDEFRNVVTFELEPDESIKVRFWAKEPGLDRHLEPREFTYFRHESEVEAQYVEEYAKLLVDAIAGDQTLFVSTDEVQAMWSFIDPITRSWAAGDVPLEYYAPDSPEIAERAAGVIGTRLARDLPEVGIVGLGRMGKGIALHLLEQGWHVAGFNRTVAVAEAMAEEGLDVARSYTEIATKLAPPRVVWVQLPAGDATEEAIFGDAGLVSVLEPGDTIIDGSNSYWRSTLERAPRLAERGIRFLDVGVSGGPAGARRGASLMIGGMQVDYERLMRLWQSVAVRNGAAFFPGHGAGHFVKMIHNGIEYGMMQAIAEGFTVLRASPFEIDLTRAAEVYDNGSVIDSRLIAWMREAFQVFGENLVGVSGSVGHTGEAQWAVQTAEELGVERRVLEAALDFRLESEDNPSYTGRILQAMRNRFGGHAL